MIGALCLFVFGASAGAFLVIRHFLRRGLPGWLAVAHGVLGAGGFAALLYFCAREPHFVPARTSLGILVVAIALGCVNVVYHLRRIRHRTMFIVAHAVAAVTGVGTLAYGAVVHPGASAASADLAVQLPAAAAPAAPGAAAVAPDVPAVAAPAAAVTASPRATRHPGPVFSDRDIEFETNGVTPTGASSAAIAAIAAAMTADPELRVVEVQGHADERGDDSANSDLTRARARAVVDALVARGVDRSRLRSAGYGARCPSDPACRGASAPRTCHEESAWRRDRRVTFFAVESSTERLRGAPECAGVR